MAKMIFVLASVVYLSAFAAEKQTVQMTGTGGRSFADGTEVKTLKQACVTANQVAQDQAANACASLDGVSGGVVHKTVIPVVNIGGHSGSCRISVDITCEVEL